MHKKISLLIDCGVSNTFNVSDLTLCDVGTFDNKSRQIFCNKGMIEDYPRRKSLT